MSVLDTVLKVLDVMSKFEPVVVNLGTNIYPFAESLYKQIKGEELTDDERADLQAAVNAKYTHFMRPQSPPQPGDPDYIKSA